MSLMLHVRGFKQAGLFVMLVMLVPVALAVKDN